MASVDEPPLFDDERTVRIGMQLINSPDLKDFCALPFPGQNLVGLDN